MKYKASIIFLFKFHPSISDHYKFKRKPRASFPRPGMPVLFSVARETASEVENFSLAQTPDEMAIYGLN
jgi:hypothetical protein